MLDNIELVEEWRPVIGFEGWYDVSNLGNVRRVHAARGTRPGRILKAQKGKYAEVDLNIHTARYRRKIHLLVATAFIGPRPEGHEVNHIDGNKKNPRVDNLEYLTPGKNEEHAYRTGLKPSGEKHHWAILTELQVIEMLRLHRDEGLGCRRLAKRFKVATKTAQLILNGTNWKSIPRGEREAIRSAVRDA